MELMETLELVAWILVVVGGLNLGLVGLLNMNVLNMLLGSIPILETVAYVLVGLSALWMLAMKFMKK